MMDIPETAILQDIWSNKTLQRFIPLISNIVMQAQVFSDGEPFPTSMIRRPTAPNNFPNHPRRLRENKIMIIKSFSYNHNQSLCVKSLFRKEEHSKAPKKPTIDQLLTQKRIAQVETCGSREVGMKKDLSDCEKQLRHFRHLEKSDIFFKINEMERKISREIRNAKHRENKRYMTEIKTNKTKSKSNRNSINLNDIPAAIRIKHIQNNNKPQPKPDNRLKTCSSFHQTRLITLIDQQRFLRDINNDPVSISHLVKLNKQTQYQKKSPGEEFSGWDTQQDYDF